MLHRHRTNRTFALIGILLLFFGPAVVLLRWAWMAHGDKACGQSFEYGCWPTEQFFAALLVMGVIFLVVGSALLFLLWRKR